MPEGDTIHRLAARLDAELAGFELTVAEAPNPRSPLHRRAGRLSGLTIERAEARGKNLLIHFEDGPSLHSHLGMNGGWRIGPADDPPYGRPWLRLGTARATASQTGGRTLRLLERGRLRADPDLARLGPDPLSSSFDRPGAVARLRRDGAGRQVGEALLDQRIVAGVGNAIRAEALHAARISPWRAVDDLSELELERVVAQCEVVMRASIATGARPHAVYGGRDACPACGGRILSRGQGDANRVAYWCPACQS